jgi:hypothetical protein
MALLYGGTPGSYPTLSRLAQPPARVCRVIQGSVWWQLIYWPWRQYKAAVAVGKPGVSPPQLASRLTPGVFCTDPASLQGCNGPADFAWRVSLSAQAQRDCQIYGCVVIEFDVPIAHQLLPSVYLPGATPGFTGGGAREWQLAGNLDLASTMVVNYVEQAPTGPRHYNLPL